MLPGFNPNQIQELEEAKQAITLLVNLVEKFQKENIELRHAVQELRNEINRLKGEQGKPDIKGNKKIGVNISSEKERQKPQKWQKSSKLDRVKIDREEILTVNKEALPADAQFNGYEQVVVQEIKIETDNICFMKEKYYSPSQQKIWLAPMPAGYVGEFGPRLRSMVITLYYGATMSEPKILEMLTHMGIMISAGQISHILTKKNDAWHSEKDEIYREGLSSSDWQHIDDTGTRVNGVNHYCHIVSNPFATVYFTKRRKDRLTLIEVLQNKTEPQFLLNNDTQGWLVALGVPKWTYPFIEKWPHDKWIGLTEITHWMERDLGRLNEQQRARVLEATALTAYHAQKEMPIVSNIMSDDAPQFKWLTAVHSLCWVHDGRYYTKLTPCFEHHQQLLADFRGRYWAYYHKLDKYRSQPNQADEIQLRQEFDTLFDTVTGYDDLDKRISRTKAKKESLLMVLKYPEMPLHNNPAELAARQRVRKRDVSFGPRTEDGVRAWDTFMTLAETAKKLEVSFYAYIFDRISGNNTLPRLVEVIRSQILASNPVSLSLSP